MINLREGILAGRRRALAQALSLVESSRAEDQAQAEELIEALYDRTGRSMRIALSGVPGVGKSTLIEELGALMLQDGHRVAVLAVDPSSPLSGGSLLGDKTRMTQLSQSEQAFIRPSPTRGHLGGVARRTRESILLCEAFGFDLILIETVGVGQSEFKAAEMADLFLYLHMPETGDELQSAKKGILEQADIIGVCKADGPRLKSAAQASQSLKNMLELSGLKPSILLVSNFQPASILKLHQEIQLWFKNHGDLVAKRREHQRAQWWEEECREALWAELSHMESFKKSQISYKKAVRAGKVLPRKAIRALAEPLKQLDFRGWRDESI